MNKSSCAMESIKYQQTSLCSYMDHHHWSSNLVLLRLQCTRGYSIDFAIGHAVFVCLSYIVRISKITMYSDTIKCEWNLMGSIFPLGRYSIQIRKFLWLEYFRHCLKIFDHWIIRAAIFSHWREKLKCRHMYYWKVCITVIQLSL